LVKLSSETSIIPNVKFKKETPEMQNPVKRYGIALTSLCLFMMMTYSASASQILNPAFDDQKWKVGNQAADGSETIIEYVLEGETVENWTELVTVHRFIGLQKQMTLEQYVDSVRSELLKTCPALNWYVIGQGEEDLMYAWRIQNCAGQPDQYEITRITWDDEAVHVIRYTHLSGELDLNRFATWIYLLKNAVLAKQ
jgi:hypothetical protein